MYQRKGPAERASPGPFPAARLPSRIAVIPSSGQPFPYVSCYRAETISFV